MQAVPFGPNYTNFLLFFGIFEFSRDKLFQSYQQWIKRASQ